MIQFRALSIALVTHEQLPDLDEDDRPLFDALRHRGHRVEAVVWSDEIDWSAFDLVILRSCWDYHLREVEFRGWLDTLERSKARVCNSPELLRWNLHKGHLLELESHGVSIPRTTWIAAGSPSPDLAAWMHRHELDAAVVKPAVSLSAHETWRVRKMEGLAAAQSRLESLTAECDVLVQEYVPEIESVGETSLVFFGGELSHTVVKLPARGDFRVQHELGGSIADVEVSAATLEQARRVLGAARSTTALYARVDGVLRGDEFVLMEIELIDPSCYLQNRPERVEAFARAIEGAAQV